MVRSVAYSQTELAPKPCPSSPLSTMAEAMNIATRIRM